MKELKSKTQCVLYARKSPEEDDKQVMSIEAQLFERIFPSILSQVLAWNTDSSRSSRLFIEKKVVTTLQVAWRMVLGSSIFNAFKIPNRAVVWSTVREDFPHGPVVLASRHCRLNWRLGSMSWSSRRRNPPARYIGPRDKRRSHHRAARAANQIYDVNQGGS